MRYARLLRQNADFRRVYLATLVSLGGDWFAIIPLLDLLAAETGGGLWGGFVLAADTALLALLSPYAGAAVDRWDRRKVMVIADLASAAVVLALLAVRGPGSAWIGVAAIGAVAIAKAFYQPASTAALPNLVAPDDLPAANVLVGAAWGTMLAVGAALGGLVASVVGPQTCFLIDAGSFVLSALLVVATRRSFQQGETARGGRPALRADLAETAAYVRAHPTVAALLTCKSGVGLGNGALTLFPLLAAGVYGAGPLGTGLLFAARGLGAVLGPVGLHGFADRGRLFSVLPASMLLFGACYVAFGFSPWYGLALALVVVAHAGGGTNWVLSTYGLQVIVPDRLRGRIFSVDVMLATMAMAVSQLVAGWLSEVVDVSMLASLFGAVTVCYALLWLVATRRLCADRSRLSAPPLDRVAGATDGQSAGAGLTTRREPHVDDLPVRRDHPARRSRAGAGDERQPWTGVRLLRPGARVARRRGRRTDRWPTGGARRRRGRG